MKKYKNRIVNDLERRLSKIDTEKKILFLKKMDVAKGYVIEIFCNQFLKNKIAIDLFKRQEFRFWPQHFSPYTKRTI